MDEGKIIQKNAEIITILRRFDGDKFFTVERLMRIEKEVEKNHQEITKIKEHLKIS